MNLRTLLAQSESMEGIISLHNDVMGIIVFITVFVMWMLFRTVSLFHEDKNATPNERQIRDFIRDV